MPFKGTHWVTALRASRGRTNWILAVRTESDRTPEAAIPRRRGGRQQQQKNDGPEWDEQLAKTIRPSQAKPPAVLEIRAAEAKVRLSLALPRDDPEIDGARGRS